jgi:tRNA (guanine-N(7)-)-methyltransferase
LFDLNSKFPEFYRYNGRRITKKVSAPGIDLIKNQYENYSIDATVIELLNQRNQNLHLSLINFYKKIIIEVGFGTGEYLINQAKLNPDYLYIGSEVYINGLAKVLKLIINDKISNIKVCGLNFIYLLKVLKPQSIDSFYIINPDPWEKRRHNKRRLLNLENLILLKEKLKKNGQIIVTTDSKDYFNSVKNLININNENFNSSKFKCMEENDSLYGVSSYQRKAMLKKENIYKIEINGI